MSAIGGAIPGNSARSAGYQLFRPPLRVPRAGLALTLQPVMKDQELVTSSSTRVTYWEGAVDAAGTFGNVAVNGRGYVEMTGYERAFRSP